jgi:cytochrome d ubiquinol oxidase subunit II
MTGIASPELFAPETLVAGVMVLALNAYVLLGGADFGGGVWDLLAAGPRREAQRALIAAAIGPIWEANHVWLIAVIVLLFTAFPPAFAQLSTVLHIPLSLMLLGIVLRGSAFTFRSYGSADGMAERRWGRVFAIASTITPLVLGVCVGAVASGDVGAAAAGADGTRSFSAVYVAPWLSAFAVGTGVLTLALFAFLAAVYLTVAAADAALQEDFRRYALGAAAAVLLAAGLVLGLSYGEAPRMSTGLTTSPWAVPLQLATVGGAATAIAALWRRRYNIARIAAALQVSLILWGWVWSQYPYLLPPHLTISSAAAPRITLQLVLWGVAGGALLLIPSLLYLFRIFASVARETTSERG